MLITRGGARHHDKTSNHGAGAKSYHNPRDAKMTPVMSARGLTLWTRRPSPLYSYSTAHANMNGRSPAGKPNNSRSTVALENTREFCVPCPGFLLTGWVQSPDVRLLTLTQGGKNSYNPRAKSQTVACRLGNAEAPPTGMSALRLKVIGVGFPVDDSNFILAPKEYPMRERVNVTAFLNDCKPCH